MKSSNLFRVAFAALTLAAAACSSTASKDKPIPADNPFRPGEREAREQKLAADELYRQARLSLDASDFSTAISRYGQIAVRFPFTEYATQADLERVYALYRNYQADESLSAADKFLKEHPRHPAADYVQYIKGLVNTTRDEGFSGFLGLDSTKEDVSFLRRAFDDFSLLAQKYPNSIYAGDARQHMIDLRNRIAQHEMHVVRFYVKRGAPVAAAKRAEQVVEQFPGAPVTVEAMQVLEDSYRAIGLVEQADDAHRLLLAQRSLPPAKSDYPLAPQKPGLFSGLTGGSKSEPTPAPVAVTPQAAPVADDRNWLQRLFTPGSKGVEGATIIVPTPAAAPPASADSAAAKSADAPAAAPAKEGEIHGEGFRVYIEPYDQNKPGEEKKPAVSAGPASDAKAKAEAKKEGSDSSQPSPP
jgi:outer membrane protein assembly factor BamD